MADAMDAACNGERRSLCKLQGLRMLDPRVFTRLPPASADSTNIAGNVGIESKWEGTSTPPGKEARAMVIRERIEAHQAAAKWERVPIQAELPAE